jgi:hypothetical protein
VLKSLHLNCVIRVSQKNGLFEVSLLYSFFSEYQAASYQRCGPSSVVDKATGYGLDGPGIESRWGRDFPHLSRPAPPSPLYNEYRVFSGGKERPGRDAEPSPLLVPWS